MWKGDEKDYEYACEERLIAIKVVELEIQLDEIKEQYNNVIRNSSGKAQQKKMAFLERNLEQLTLVQKQVQDCNYIQLGTETDDEEIVGGAEFNTEERGRGRWTKAFGTKRPNPKFGSDVTGSRPTNGGWKSEVWRSIASCEKKARASTG
jgi:hypothetical protein